MTLIPPKIDRSLIKTFPELGAVAENLERIGERFAALEYPPFPHDDSVWPGLSRRCKAIAYANLLRGEELLRLAILSINDRAIIAAQVLTRALDETFAVVAFARRKIEHAVAEGNPQQLAELLNRLTCGNRYMAKRDPKYSESFNVQTMVDETDKYIAEMGRERGKALAGEWRAQYDYRCEFVHPSMGSFALYQRRKGNEYHWDRKFGEDPSPFSDLLSGLCASSSMLLREAELLSEIRELSPDWPGFRQTPGDP